MVGWRRARKVTKITPMPPWRRLIAALFVTCLTIRVERRAHLLGLTARDIPCSFDRQALQPFDLWTSRSLVSHPSSAYQVRVSGGVALIGQTLISAGGLQPSRATG